MTDPELLDDLGRLLTALTVAWAADDFDVIEDTLVRARPALVAYARWKARQQQTSDAETVRLSETSETRGPQP